MRKLIEPTMRNLLRQRLVAGISTTGLIGLTGMVTTIQILGGNSNVGNVTAVGAAVVGYVVLRVLARFAKPGWEEAWIFEIEKRISKHKGERASSVIREIAKNQPQSSDTLDDAELIRAKAPILERLHHLRVGERLAFVLDRTARGASIWEVKCAAARFFMGDTLWKITDGFISDRMIAYSLYQLPVNTDPFWISEVLAGIPGRMKVIVTYQGLDPFKIKSQIERSRKRNSTAEGLSHVDSDITFEEASLVLRGLSSGSEKVLSCSVVVLAEAPTDLDPELFCREKTPLLSVASALGLRKRPHRSLIVRSVTASDLYPSFLDPSEAGSPILKTIRGNPLYFDPQDTRLEALHWLVSGASGSGKSFFTGLVLKRMIGQGVPMSVLFVDHNRSFRKLVRSSGEEYLEPQSLCELQSEVRDVVSRVGRKGVMAGIELSDLPVGEKKAATQALLGAFEAFLRSRDSVHPVYLVLDECWNFMRDEPLLVQRAFREFRKLNGAAIAITQSLSDFLSDESGNAIFQSAPIRVLLRQGEDPNLYRGVLGLNDREVGRLRFLSQEKGHFSECLIKTPFLSRIGRLYPSTQEHDTLRTDTLRAEMIAEAKTLREEALCGSA